MAKLNGSVARRNSVGEALDLRKTRLSKGVSLEDIADKTKISIGFLRAIEAEEFEKLPGGIFTTSYLRQYAAAIGLEESRLLDYHASKSSAGLNTQELRLQPPAKASLLRFFSTAAER